MSHNRRGRTLRKRHGKVGKRQALDPLDPGSSTVLGPSDPAISIPSPEPEPPSSTSLPIPSITSTPHTTVTVVPSLTPKPTDASTITQTSASVITTSSSSSPSSSESTPRSSAPPSSVSSVPAASSAPSSTPSQAPSSSTPGSSSRTTSPSSDSDVTSVITSMSGTQVVTVTTVTRPSASLSPDDPSNNSFFKNKAESGAVLALVGIVGVAGIAYLGFRFYKSAKQRSVDRETEEAARAAARVRVRLDDDDDDRYGGIASAHSALPPMIQLRNIQPGGFESFAGDGAGLEEFDDGPSTENHNHYLYNGGPSYPVPLHQHQPSLQNDSLHIQTILESSDISESAHSAVSRRSGESGDLLISTSSNLNGGGRSDSGSMSRRPKRANSTGLGVRSESETSGSSHMRSVTQGSLSNSRPASRPLSGSFTSSHTPSSTVSRSHSTHLLERPPLPTLPLPEAFGEGEPNEPGPRMAELVRKGRGKSDRPSTAQSVMGDNEDYQGTTSRVLKIANE